MAEPLSGFRVVEMTVALRRPRAVGARRWQRGVGEVPARLSVLDHPGAVLVPVGTVPVELRPDRGPAEADPQPDRCGQALSPVSG